MSSLPPQNHRSDTLILVCPDWLELELPLQLPNPFVLWPVGDQPLLYHWFDYAQDQGYEKVQVRTTDRPDRVRRAVNRATLWPLQIECVTTSRVDADRGLCIHGLPECPPLTAPANGWDLLSHWLEMDKQWLKQQAGSQYNEALSIGRLCNIHPEANLVPPYFIGDQVSVGPGATIGPNAVLGTNSLVAEGSIVRNARLIDHSFLGAELTLENAILNGGVLYNCKHRARVNRIDSFLADSTRLKAKKPPLGERLLALYWWLRLRLKLAFGLPTQPGIPSPSGTTYPGLGRCPLWAQRLPWLWEAARGRMQLYGPLPRSREQLENLPADWQDILREAMPGAIAYSDCMDCHSPDDPMEGLHAVYQVTHPERTRPQCAFFLKNLTQMKGPL